MLAQLDLISGHSWRRATFTTYALSLSFFEAVVLDALVRGDGREALILADVEGVRAAIGEQGARRVGKDYDVEPIAVSAGIFHPKLSVLVADDECHLLVGSGNLTFGGWGGNLEVIEHLHPSFAADAISDAADFFQILASSDRARHGAAGRCEIISEDLRAATRNQRSNGNIRLFHSLDGPISEKLTQAVGDLGGAVRLVAAAPFWDDGSAIDELCAALELDEVFIHVHDGGTVEGKAGTNWPARALSTVHPVRLRIMNENKPRRLHAKVFEVICKRGRLILSGSANGTTAALGGPNIEACIVRVHREAKTGWKFVAAEHPELLAAQETEDEEDSELTGVLRATLEAERIAGQILTPTMTGTISVFQVTTEGVEALGEAKLDAAARFNLRAPGLELQSWKGGRLVLQIRDASDRRAEGFVSVAAFAAITRRAGAMAPRLLAVLAGTETPADVAAIMSWFHEDPRRLAGAVPTRITGGVEEREEEVFDDRTVPVAELNSAYAASVGPRGTETAAGGASWRRFMEHVFSAFRERRAPFGQTAGGRKGEDDDDDDDFNGAPDSGAVDPAITRSLEVFDDLLELMLSDHNAPHHAVMAFDLTQYVCERLVPDFHIAKAWLDCLVDTITRIQPPPERRDEIAAAILALLACDDDYSGGPRLARTRLLRLGYPLSGAVPPSEQVRGLQSVLTPKIGFAEAWTAVQTVRTFQEQTRAYLAAFKSGRPSADYADLSKEVPEEWPVLRDALSSPTRHDKILVLEKWSNACPVHHMTLPGIELSKLHTIGIATAKNCCRRVLVYPGS